MTPKQQSGPEIELASKTRFRQYFLFFFVFFSRFLIFLLNLKNLTDTNIFLSSIINNTKHQPTIFLFCSLVFSPVFN